MLSFQPSLRLACYSHHVHVSLKSLSPVTGVMAQLFVIHNEATCYKFKTLKRQSIQVFIYFLLLMFPLEIMTPAGAAVAFTARCFCQQGSGNRHTPAYMNKTHTKSHTQKDGDNHLALMCSSGGHRVTQLLVVLPYSSALKKNGSEPPGGNFSWECSKCIHFIFNICEEKFTGMIHLSYI